MTDLDELAQRRAQYVKEQLGIRKRLALAFSYRELGYSTSGLAKKLDVTEGTTKKYVRQLDKNEQIERDVYKDVVKTKEELEIKDKI
jgi:DNA-binding MarR family transcriptional regulator